MAGACSVCVKHHGSLNGRRSDENDSAKHARESDFEKESDDGKSDSGKEHDGESDFGKESVCDDDSVRNYEKANVCGGDANDCLPHDDDVGNGSFPNDGAIVPFLSSFAAVP